MAEYSTLDLELSSTFTNTPSDVNDSNMYYIPDEAPEVLEFKQVSGFYVYGDNDLPHIPVIVPSESNDLLPDRNQGDGLAGNAEDGLLSVNTVTCKQDDGLSDLLLTDPTKFLNLNSPEVAPTVTALPCNKKRNPYYVVDGKNITTRNHSKSASVTFSAANVEGGDTLRLCMLYKDAIHQNKPVLACPNHQQVDVANSANFIVLNLQNSHIDHMCDDEHPVQVIEVNAGDIRNGTFKFQISFFCHNLCHRVNGKDMYLKLDIISRGKLATSETFDIRVCENVRRDAEKRKRSPEREEVGVQNVLKRTPSVKVRRIKVEKSFSSDSRPPPVTFQMPDEDRMATVKKVIYGMGGIFLPNP